MSGCRVCSAETDAFMCKPCCGEVTRALGDAKSLMHEVSNLATGQTRVYRANGKPQPIDDDGWIEEYRKIPAWLRSPIGKQTLIATRPMVRLDARELLWEAGNTLSSWARALAESRGIEIPPGDWLTWLTESAESFRWSEEAEQIHDEITYLHHRMAQAVDRSPSRLFAGPCHAQAGRLAEMWDDQIIGGRCQRDLYARAGADEIVCDGYRGDETGCEATHTPDSRREWLLASVESALLPLDTWRQTLPKILPEMKWPPRQTWWRWADPEGRHQRLFSPTTDRVGVALYRGGDVLDVVRGAQSFLATRGGRRSA